MMWRHGPMMITAAEGVPSNARRRAASILTSLEATGHCHQVVERGAAELWDSRGELFLRILTDRATIVHEEHRPITLLRGVYRVW